MDKVVLKMVDFLSIAVGMYAVDTSCKRRNIALSERGTFFIIRKSISQRIELHKFLNMFEVNREKDSSRFHVENDQVMRVLEPKARSDTAY